MRKYLTVTLCVALLFISTGIACAVERITILHVNDFHGRINPYVDKTIDADKPVGGAAYLASMVAGQRVKNPGGTILLSAGDMFQGTPVSNLFQGKPVLEIMNELRFDAMALGNHEFDWGRDVLAGNLLNAAFPFLSANIINGNGQLLPGVKPYVMIERKGVKLAVIGITTPETAYTTRIEYVKDLKFVVPEETVPPLIREVKAKGARLVVLLTHLGLAEDKKLAAAVPGIDVIVGGHSHTVVTDPVVVGRTIIVQAGYNGLYLGVLELAVDARTGRIVEATRKSELRAVSAGPEVKPDRNIAQIVDMYEQRVKSRFAQVVGETKTDLIRHADGESNIGDAITDAVRAAMGAEIAFHNSGGIRADISAGKITMEQIYTVLPFDNVVLAMDLKGEDVLALLEKSAGLTMGMLQVSGVTFRCDLTKPAGKRLSGVMVGKAPLEATRTYRVATNDFLAAGGDNFTEFQKGTNLVFGGTLRDVFVGYLQKSSPISPKPEGRITVTGR